MIAFPDLPSSEVHIWWINTEYWNPIFSDPPSPLSKSDPTEIKSLSLTQTKKRPSHSQAFVRFILSTYANVPLSQLQWQKNAYGKPIIYSPASARSLFFNVAHSGPITAIALARNRPVGIDIELNDPEKFDLEVVKRYFTPSEQQELLDTPPNQQLKAFLRCWTRKEAYLKAIGLGLHLEQTDFSISLDSLSPQFLNGGSHPAQQGPWKICHLDLENGITAALSAKQHDWTEKIFNLKDHFNNTQIDPPWIESLSSFNLQTTH